MLYPPPYPLSKATHSVPVAHPLRESARRAVPVPDLVVVAVAALLVLGGAVGPVPPAASVALATASGCALATARLGWLGGGGRRPEARTEGMVEARREALPHRCAGLLSAGVLAAGLTVAVLPLAAVKADRQAVATIGLLVASVLHAGGLFLLPGRPRLPSRLRLRRAAGGLSLGLSLIFASWVVLPAGDVPVLARTAALVAAGGLAAIVVMALTDCRRRAGTAICRAGTAMTLLGLASLVVLFAYRVPDRAALVVVPLLVAGALLTAAGARRVARADPPRPSGPLSIWPQVTAPAGIAMLAAGYHLWAVGDFDPTAVVLGFAVIPPMVLRDLLGADRRPYTARLAAQQERPALPPAPVRDGRGDWRDIESTVSGQRAVPEAAALVVHRRDVGQRRRSDRTPHEVAAIGPLTAVAGRSELMRALTGPHSAPGRGGALLMVDVVGTAAINDGRGHSAGDCVLVEVVRRLRAVAGPDDLVARLAGEEFAVVTDSGPVLAYALGARLLAALTEPYQLRGAVVRLPVSIGLAEFAGAGAEDVLRQADLARRRARQLGRNRVEWYDAYLEEQLVRRLDLERELPGAIARGELDLVYQPVLGLDDQVPVGVEALLRWRSPVLGTVLPAELLPVAEELGIVGALGQWVLHRACRQLAAWSAASPHLWMAVNVTPRELTATDFVQRVAAVLAEHGVPAERLVVEVAEPRIATDLSTVVARLAGLRLLGVRTALDHFSAAHASLAQLRRLPIDLLKVDRQPVGGSTSWPRCSRAPGAPAHPLIDVVVALGHRLGLEVVAEGLESTAQVDQARRAGCRYGQGFALARPATAERVEAYLEEFRSASR